MSLAMSKRTERRWQMTIGNSEGHGLLIYHMHVDDIADIQYVGMIVA